MNFAFRRGDAASARGHAFACFEAPDGRLFATYLVIPPVAIDLAKYMPPMFASHFPMPTAAEVTAMPLPPMPEEVPGGLPQIDRLAELRNDDVVMCGQLDPRQLDRLLTAAAEAGQAYVALYRDVLSRAPAAAPAEEPVYSVDDVLLDFLSEHDRIGRVAKLIGQLRYAVEGGDEKLAEETVAAMNRVGKLLPEKYRLEEVVAAARRADNAGARLAQLHVERCYKLSAEEYAEVARLEAEIRALSRT